VPYNKNTKNFINKELIYKRKMENFDKNNEILNNIKFGKEVIFLNESFLSFIKEGLK